VPDLVTVTQWAEAQGITRQAANKRIREHRIPRHAGGKIDPDEADRIFKFYVDSSQQSKSVAKKKKSVVRVDRAPVGDLPKDEIDRRIAAVKLSRQALAFQKEKGSLVDAAEIERATEARIREDAEAVLNWPSKISSTWSAELGIDPKIFYESFTRRVREFMISRSKQ